MKSMGHPDYEYRPLSDERRERLSVAQRKRLGVPEGHSRVYGIHVPDSMAGHIRVLATKIASKQGFEAAHAFVARASANEWRVDAPEAVIGPRQAVYWTPERRKAHSDMMKARHAAKRAAEEERWRRITETPEYKLRAKLNSFREGREKARVRWNQFNDAIKELEAAESLLRQANVALRKHGVIDRD